MEPSLAPELNVRVQDNASPPEKTTNDSSNALFSMYLSRAETFDKEQAESWKGYADSILVFTGLFSATVSAFIIEGYKGLQPDPDKTVVGLLEQISQQLAGISNGTHVSVSTSTNPPVFHPSASAVWVNSLWFLSLAISLACALIATLLQQWARRYLHVTHRRHAIHTRARIRTYFAEGARRLHLPTVVGIIPALLHVSVFLFFAGLAIFVSDINRIVSAILLSFIATCGLAYIMLSILPLIFHSSPYQTPLSAAIWSFFYGTFLLILKLARRAITQLRPLPQYDQGSFRSLINKAFWRCHSRFKLGMSKTCENSATLVPWTIDARALLWTLESIDDDSQLLRFLAAIPGFHQSRVVRSPKAILSTMASPTGQRSVDIPARVLSIMHSPPTIGTLAKSEKRQRDLTCLRALYHIPGCIVNILLNSLNKNIQTSAFSRLFGTMESWLLAEALSRGYDRDVALAARCVAAVLPRRKLYEINVPILMRQLRLSKPVVREYLRSRDSILFANLIRFTWYIINHASDMDDKLRSIPAMERDAVLTIGGISPPDDTNRSSSVTLSPSALRILYLHQLLRYTFDHLTADSFQVKKIAPKLLSAFAEVWDYVEYVKRTPITPGTAYTVQMVLEKLRPLRDSLPRAAEAESSTSVTNISVTPGPSAPAPAWPHAPPDRAAASAVPDRPRTAPTVQSVAAPAPTPPRSLYEDPTFRPNPTFPVPNPVPSPNSPIPSQQRTMTSDSSPSLP